MRRKEEKGKTPKRNKKGDRGQERQQKDNSAGNLEGREQGPAPTAPSHVGARPAGHRSAGHPRPGAGVPVKQSTLEPPGQRSLWTEGSWKHGLTFY